MIGISDTKMSEHFKESFLQKIESQLLKIEDIEKAIVKAGILALLFRMALPQPTSNLH